MLHHTSAQCACTGHIHVGDCLSIYITWYTLYTFIVGLIKWLYCNKYFIDNSYAIRNVKAAEVKHTQR